MIRILRLPETVPAEGLTRQIEAIFFESAGTKDFTSAGERTAYLDLWLGRYIRHFPDAFFIAFDGKERVAGYLAGSLASDRLPLPGPSYYKLFPRSLIGAYPAHMHVNVRQDRRGQGVGSSLAAAFRIYCLEKKAAGFHAVTAAESRSAAFFKNCGLAALAEADWESRRIGF